MNKYKILRPLVTLAIIAAAGGIVMLLWNYIIPSTIGWNSLNYFQATGLLVLCRLLFGGFGGFRRAKQRFRAQYSHQDVRYKIKEMSKEQKIAHIKEYMAKNIEQEQ